jgi:type III secretion protein V
MSRPEIVPNTRDVRSLLARHSDLALAGSVALIVGMMILPLPPFVLDLLVTLNIAVAVTLLLIAVYVSEALRIATFPSLLLMTTLFRLAIEVSAARLILLKANAGQVIYAFGNFVVAGNLVVGAVVFLILTLIQFIVISKGSERVAEVGARFALDAMPGKQMSIDAELRAGHIDLVEARRRRDLLTRESQFFGSMDGAMKFVKGDAIAGMVVLLTNIVGGLLIGILQKGMSPAIAVKTYTLLTIGAGLVAQIPALVISSAAGILVTRVSSEHEGGHLGLDIGRQVLAQPKALAVAAALLGLLALVPGLPTLPFLLLGGLLGVVAYTVIRQDRRNARTAAHHQSLPGSTGAPAPITVELSSPLSQALVPAAGPNRLADELLPAARERFFAETGIPLPIMGVRLHVPSLTGNHYRLCLQDIPMAQGQVTPGAGVPEEAILTHLMQLLQRHGHEFLGLQETHELLSGLERTQPALVREVVPKLLSPTLLTEVLRRLAQEGISLRNLREILGALAERASSVTDPAALTEHVRAALRRQISFAHTGGSGLLRAYFLDSMIEDTLRESIHHGAAGDTLALQPDLAADIVKSVGQATTTDAAAVIVTSTDLRLHLRRLIADQHPKVSVLSYQEIEPAVKLESLGQISVSAK